MPHYVVTPNEVDPKFYQAFDEGMAMEFVPYKSLEELEEQLEDLFALVIDCDGEIPVEQHDLLQQHYDHFQAGVEARRAEEEALAAIQEAAATMIK